MCAAISERQTQPGRRAIESVETNVQSTRNNVLLADT